VRVVSIGLFCSEYPISLGNALARDNAVTLFLSREDLASGFPQTPDLEARLREWGVVEPALSLRFVDTTTGRLLRRVRLAGNVAHEVSALQPDVVHYQSSGNLHAPLILALLRRFPKVVTIHDVNPHPGDFPPPRVVHLITRIVSRQADQIIVHGRQQAEALQALHGTAQSKISVIPHGAYHLFRSCLKSAAAEDPRRVLFFGRIRAYKGIQHLLEAVPLVAEVLPDVRFHVVGHGDPLEWYGYAPGRSKHLIVEQRFVPMEEVGSLFQQAAVVAVPYTDASQSGVVNLAYAFGKPVVCTRVGSIPEIVDDGQTGYLVEPGDSRQLADALIKVLSDPELRCRMGRRALHKAETELSWERIAIQTQEVYRRTLAGKTR
jgi:glycosyltransferase involved in cell wall biosynthesis